MMAYNEYKNDIELLYCRRVRTLSKGGDFNGEVGENQQKKEKET